MGPSTSTGPLFASFLLPSITLPFRRRRSARASGPKCPVTRSANNQDSSPVPSLSSSPTSTLSDCDPAPLADVDAPYYWTDLDEHRRPSLGGAELSTLHRLQPDIIRCGTCAVDLAFGAQIVSKGFTGRYGRAFLVGPPSSLSTTPVDLGLDPRPHGISKRDAEALDDTELLNIKIGSRENRQLVTGAHVVADITCAVCGTKVGWKYVQATEASQKYKEGKFILETQRVVVFRSWEDVECASAPGRRDSVDTGRRSPSLRNSVDPGAADDVDATEPKTEKDDTPDHEILFDSEDEEECEDIFSGTWDPAVVIKRRRTKISRLRGKK